MPNRPLPAHADVPYAALSPAQKLDIYLPDHGESPLPVILHIHGGAFMGGDKADTQLEPMLAGLARGYAVVSINYRLSGEALFPAQIQDIKAAVRWVRAHTAQYGFDPARVAAWGGSAGGHLSALAGLTPGVPALDDPSLGSPGQSDALQAVVDWFGPTDFLKMDEQAATCGFAPGSFMVHSEPRSPESLLLGDLITRVPERVLAANPEAYITPAAPPFFIQHGTHDVLVPWQQSAGLAARLEAVCGPGRVTLELLEGAAHGDPKFASPENVRKVLDFLDARLA